MFDDTTQAEFNQYGKIPSEDASAEEHMIAAIERFQFRGNTTNDVKIDAHKLDEFHSKYVQQKKEILELKSKIQSAVFLLTT